MTRFTLGSSEKKVTNYIASAFRQRQLSGKRRHMAMQRIPKTVLAMVGCATLLHGEGDAPADQCMIRV